jgi:preprotein translocase subunit SecG
MGSFSIFLVLIVLVAFLLVLVIMVQNPKGGGLSSSFGGGGTQQLGGVKKTTDFLDKSTWALAVMLVLLILASNFSIKPNENSESIALGDTQTEQPNTNSLPPLQEE